ncbi:Aste57867_14467 [Aphanomyces stellatus]|uniref:Aste57867_14467 protein n=1 Tax=Aphanomyces stellatus TaxID=120398 RepID=A0A485L1K0_9STRA|nr:hypothetical protein As57867_014413 [Aphanomyces stellatus]VFT91289.1 Aste57867_14467 [Aphanomyces stellatus]
MTDTLSNMINDIHVDQVRFYEQKSALEEENVSLQKLPAKMASLTIDLERLSLEQDHALKLLDVAKTDKERVENHLARLSCARCPTLEREIQDLTHSLSQVEADKERDFQERISRIQERADRLLRLAHEQKDLTQSEADEAVREAKDECAELSRVQKELLNQVGILEVHLEDAGRQLSVGDEERTQREHEMAEATLQPEWTRADAMAMDGLGPSTTSPSGHDDEGRRKS